MENGKIFISYRREDTSGESGRLKDKLEQIFGRENIFYDVETLEAGLNFDQSIAKALSESKVLLAMIGPHWLKVADSKGALRLQKPEDWVRKEIGEALRRDLRVIPILVNGADMPDPEDLPEELKQLSLKHAQELSSSRWNYDVGELSKVLEKIIAKKPERASEPIVSLNPRPIITPSPQPKSWWAKNYLWVLGGVVGFFLLIGMCVPNDTATSPEYDATVVTADEVVDPNSAQESQSSSDFPESDSQVELFIPDLTGDWVLYLNGQKASILTFTQTGTDVSYVEYDILDQLTGEGQGQLNGLELTMSYYAAANDIKGDISMISHDTGQTWVGTIYFPETAVTANLQLSKN